MIAQHSERLTTGLRALAMAFVAVAAAALLWRPSLEAELPDESAGALVGDSLRVFPAVSPARVGDAQRVAASNIFAASRRAPGRRYAPGSDVPASSATIGDAGMPFDPANAADTPSLLGTVLDALGDRALILAPQVDSIPRFYRVGERAGSYRIRRIEAGRVLLDGPSGRVVLELLKPTEARP
ncbi:MAG: hypothetical protein ACT4P6_20350 [Gemmatimonadaceae bacterium]